MDRIRSASVIAPTRIPIAAIVLACSAAIAQTPSLTLIGFAPGTEASRIYGLSADGRFASGYSQEPTSSTTHFPGFRWNADTGRQDFGVGLAPALTLGLGISGDGSTIVGGAHSSETGPSTAFRWSASGGFNSLGLLPSYANSEAHDANQDGSIIVGTATSQSGTSWQAFRWTQSGGMQGLGAGTTGQAISRDGSTIIGNFGTAPNAFRWTQAGGLQFLPTLSGVGGSIASGVNDDGSIIVGRSGTNSLPTMWINGVASEILPGSSNIYFSPGLLNDAGTVVAGQGQPPGGGIFPAVWTQATGTIRLTDYLTANGVVLPAGLELFSCTAMSADGRTFAGWTTGAAFGTQGYVATLGTLCLADLDNDGDFANGGTRDRAVTIDDLLYFLTAFESGNLAADLDNGSGTGVHDVAVTVEDLLYFLTHFEAGC